MPRRFARRDRLPCHHDVAILVVAGCDELPLRGLDVCSEPSSNLLERLCLRLEFLHVRDRQAMDNRVDGALELPAALGIALEHGDAEWPQLLDDVLAQHPQSLGGVRRHEYALALG